VSRVEKCELPANALLRGYRVRGDYADCFTTTVPKHVTHAEFVTAFYTTPLFRLERFVLFLIGKPSSDDDARELAAHGRDTFAAWSVEARAQDQLLLCDFRHTTRSWLMTAAEGNGTRLYFGSAVVRRGVGPSGEKRMTIGFKLLLGFHQSYSRGLLNAARRRV
jgi:hypothetical protein